MMDFTPNDGAVLVGEVGDGNGRGFQRLRHLYGVGSDVPRGSDDYHGLSAHRLRILENSNLPGGYRNEREPMLLLRDSAIGGLRASSGRGHGELGLGATELRIGTHQTSSGRPEARNAGADLLDDTGEVRTRG